MLPSWRRDVEVFRAEMNGRVSYLPHSPRHEAGHVALGLPVFPEYLNATTRTHSPAKEPSMRRRMRASRARCGRRIPRARRAAERAMSAAPIKLASLPNEAW